MLNPDHSPPPQHSRAFKRNFSTGQVLAEKPDSTNRGVTHGMFEGIPMTLAEARNYFSQKKEAYNPHEDKGSTRDFTELANGFWQAEGYIGGHFKSDLNFYPLCTSTQLLSDHSISFFLRLNNALSDKGTFSITLNNFNKFVIQYKLSGWDTFFNVFIPYFCTLYGAKFQAIAKLTRIYAIKELIKKGNSDIMLRVELIDLAYSLTAHNSKYKLDIKEKLTSLGIDGELLNSLPYTNYPDNSRVPTFLFILGFF